MFSECCRALNDSKHQLLRSADGALSLAKGKANFPSKQKLSDSTLPGCSGGLGGFCSAQVLISWMPCGESLVAGRFQPPGAQEKEKKKGKKRAVTERGNSPVVKCCCCMCLEVVIFVLVSLKAAGSLFGFPEAFSHQLLSSCSHKGKVTKHAPLHPKSINPIPQKCQPRGQAKPMPRYPGYNSEGRKLIKKRKMFLF